MYSSSFVIIYDVESGINIFIDNFLFHSEFLIFQKQLINCGRDERFRVAK